MTGCEVPVQRVLQLVASPALVTELNLKQGSQLEPLTYDPIITFNPSSLVPTVTSAPCFFQGCDFPSPYVPPKTSDHEEEPQAQEGKWEDVFWGAQRGCGDQRHL